MRNCLKSIPEGLHTLKVGLAVLFTKHWINKLFSEHIFNMELSLVSTSVY